ncbi:MAG TPA: hypothetical protein VH250_06475 [Granulicella sp.]|jgi:hypothetical protein|nr:hypothetical protein [Granulicella sp.]
MSDTEKDKLIRALFAAWETSLHNVDTLRIIVQDVPDWEQKFALYQQDFERTLYTTRRLAPIRKAIREIVGSDDSHTLLQEAQKLLNRKLN